VRGADHGDTSEGGPEPAASGGGGSPHRSRQGKTGGTGRKQKVTERPVEIPELSPGQMDWMVSVFGPYRRIVQPKLYGIENLPADGSLLAANHTIYGVLDAPIMITEIWRVRRIAARGLGAHGHYALPVWREFLTAGGMVRGTRDNVRALMRDRQTILVYPGGAREVNKHRGQQYQLQWRERMGFAQLAIEHGYPVIPVASVGADDMLDVIIDQDTPVYGEFACLYEKFIGFPTLPVAVGVGGTPIPRPERLYFWFGEPIDATRFGSSADDHAAAQALHEEVKQAVVMGI